MPAIVTLTMNPAIDVSSTVDRVVPGHKLRCTAPRYEPGGGGINIGRAVHKLGGEAAVYYAAGGATGQALRELLDREGLDHHAIRIDGWTRINAAILDESTWSERRGHVASRSPASRCRCRRTCSGWCGRRRLRIDMAGLPDLVRLPMIPRHTRVCIPRGGPR